MRTLILAFLFVLPISATIAQVRNDECFSATNIPNISDFCGSDFTNENAQPSNVPAPQCWGLDREVQDVWYTFQPRQQGLQLRFFGSGSTTPYTIDNVGIALYEGSCSALSEVDCTTRPDNADDIFERLYSDLTIGRLYYLRVSSPIGSAGTFELCLSEFVPIPEPQQDCPTGVILCDKSTFIVESLTGVGNIPDEANGSCLNGVDPTVANPFPESPSETSSAWYKWTAASSGTLTFTLTPSNPDPQEDLDFAIYRLPAGIDDCRNKELLLCMGSGAPTGNEIQCLGPTGLRSGENDINEYVNCEGDDNNFLRPLDMVAGESYALIVNNFSISGFGFSIEFGGTGTFLGPEPEFSIDATQGLECDKTITFTDISTSLTDPISNYSWTFGDGALPNEVTGTGPHDVVYESFGNKTATLTVESSRGCLITVVKDIEVESCCGTVVNIDLEANVTDLTCFESGDGVITALASNGNPDYLYSLDNGPLLPDDMFGGLDAGSYTLSVQDIKGCEESRTVTVNQPLEIDLILMGPIDSVELGQGAQLSSDFMPSDRILEYEWTPPNGLSCDDCPDPMVIPPGTTTYTLRVTDQDGCMTSETITVFTKGTKPIYAPNIISLSGEDPDNGFFRIFGNRATESVELLEIYDRWGGQMYSVRNININEPNFKGWDGIVLQSGKKVNPGVYVWTARVRFIDGEVRTIVGDLTVID